MGLLGIGGNYRGIRGRSTQVRFEGGDGDVYIFRNFIKYHYELSWYFPLFRCLPLSVMRVHYEKTVLDSDLVTVGTV